ncbi:MAG TPA: ATP-binding protein [Gaiellaceae bacterium]|nr:ATP-binding protein [Gaiellaceae bacterium]
MALRLRRLAVGCALGSAGSTVALVLVASLNFALHAPALHVALETTAAIAASAAAFLLLGRFWRTGFLDELLLSAGLSLLALSNFAFAALPAVFHLESNRDSVWTMLYTATLAALLIGVAALLPRRRIAAGRRWPFVIYGATLVVALAGSIPMSVFPQLLPRGLAVSPRADVAATGVVGALQLGLTLLYILAALGFARRHRLTSDELSGWLTIACILSGASRVNYFFHPAAVSNWVYTGDIFRLGFYLALLIGAAREIASYWTSVVAAASLEERRRLARDVHDGLAQEIAFIGRNVRLLRDRGADPQLIERILRSVGRAQEESRRVVGALAARVDEPLDEALAQAVRDAASRYGASIDMELASGISLSPREREAVVRIASEAVANAARHSGAEVLKIYLERVEAGMRLEVVDDGEGFDEKQPRRGFGLVTMKDRAEALGGKLRIDSRRGAGTRVELEL